MGTANRPREHEAAESAWMLLGPLGVLVVALGLAALLALLGLMGLSPSPLTWYLARASGLTLYLLLWLSLVSGLGLTTRLLDLLGGRRVVWDLHRLATELAYSFLALHVLSLAADPSVPLGATGVLLVSQTSVRQPWTDIGIVTAYGFTVVAASFSLRRLIGNRIWRALHYATFPLWVTALLHGLGAGTDTGRPWAILLYVTTAAVAALMTASRLARSIRPWQQWSEQSKAASGPVVADVCVSGVGRRDASTGGGR